MRKKSSPIITKEVTKDGVDKIIDYLVANRENIGAIVFDTAPNAGKKMPSWGDPLIGCDGIRGAADRIAATSQSERASAFIRSPITVGLAMMLADKLK